MPECGRHRIVIVAIAHERQRVDPSGALVASVIGRRKRRLERGQVPLQQLADRLPVMSAQAVGQPRAAALQEMGVECCEVGESRHGHHEVAPRIPDQPLDLAFVVALAGAAKAVREQVVRLQFGKDTGAHAAAVAQDGGRTSPRRPS